RLPNARRATPGVYLRLFPTRQMRAVCELTSTSPSSFKSWTIPVSEYTLSNVSDTETSDVATMSTEVRWRSNTSNNARKNPCAINIRDDETVTTVMPRLHAMDLMRFLHGRASSVMRVPVPFGFLEFKI